MDLVQQVFLALILGLLVVIVTFYFQTSSFTKSSTSKPTFLILGINNAGKTGLYYKLMDEDSKVSTVSSIEKNAGFINVPFSQKSIAKPYQFIDYPGHMKYFNLLIKLITEIGLNKIKGIVFVIDSSAAQFNQSTHVLTKYLFNLLSITERTANGVDFLFAINKLDLFDSLPASKVQTILTEELNKLIQSELSAIDKNESDVIDLETLREFWLSVIGNQKNKFSFDQLEGNMDFQSGSVLKNKLDSWKNWIDERVVN